jgi:hypothetical protein
MLWTLGVDLMIIIEYNESDQAINLFLAGPGPRIFLIAAGEICAISAAYKAVYSSSHPKTSRHSPKQLISAYLVAYQTSSLLF